MEILLTSRGLALLFLVLGIPLMLGKVKRNSLYGARFPATMADDHVWDVVNRKTGFVFVSGGTVAGIVDLLAVAGVVTRDVGQYVVGALVAYIFIASVWLLSLIHISEPTRLGMISYAVFCLKKKKKIIEYKI